MKRTVYENYCFPVLRAVVENPMQRGIAYASRLGMPHGRATHVLIGLKKEGYIDYYDYEFTNVFKGMHRHYYPLEKGIAIVCLIEANID
tara:strand:- start:56 stop:322 length:267 start_codon:yes stop_codon:yes gene_type:complete